MLPQTSQQTQLNEVEFGGEPQKAVERRGEDVGGPNQEIGDRTHLLRK